MDASKVNRSVVSRALLLPAWAVFALCVALPAAGAQTSKLVLYLNEDGARVSAALEKLRAAIQQSDWARRHEVRLEHVVIDPASPALAAVIKEALSRRPAAIIATSGTVAQVAKTVTRDVPIIFGAHQDPVAIGLAESLNAPGGNLTGMTLYSPVEAKRIELLSSVKRLRVLGVVVNQWWDRDPGTRGFDVMVRTRFGLEIRYFRAETSAQLRTLLSERRVREVDGWYVSSEPAFSDPEGTAAAINATGKPAVYTLGLVASRGGLMSYQAILEDPFGTWAKLLGLVLDGVPPGSIPVEGPRRFELQLNQDTARRLGITFPRHLMMRATQIHDTTRQIEKSSPAR